MATASAPAGKQDWTTKLVYVALGLVLCAAGYGAYLKFYKKRGVNKNNAPNRKRNNRRRARK